MLLIMTDLHDPTYSRWLRKARISFITTSNQAKAVRYCSKWFAGPHIIHNHSSHTMALAKTLSSQLHIPTITTVHYLDFELMGSLASQDAVILISPEMDEVLGTLGPPTYIVENGVPLPLLHRKAWRQQALFLAQVTPDKEDNFRRMTECLLSWDWNVHSAGNWKHKGVVQYGWVNRIYPLLAQSDLVLGTGRAVREAMIAGKPAWVLGTYSDGLVTSSNVEHLRKTNFSGRSSKQRFEASDAALHLKNPVPSILQALGSWGRRYAEQHFSIEDMTRKLIAIYEECISKCSRDTVR